MHLLFRLFIGLIGLLEKVRLWNKPQSLPSDRWNKKNKNVFSFQLIKGWLFKAQYNERGYIEAEESHKEARCMMCLFFLLRVGQWQAICLHATLLTMSYLFALLAQHWAANERPTAQQSQTMQRTSAWLH